MVTVAAAEKIILNEAKDYGAEELYFEDALGRVLAQDIIADRDLPPYNRVTMDGIAIRYDAFAAGIRSFKITATQAAGDVPCEIRQDNECIEIMTGAALPSTTDTVIRYEDLDIKDGYATITVNDISKSQSIHFKGRDKKAGELVLKSGAVVNAAVIQVAASTGLKTVLVKKIPKVVIISSGDELVEVDAAPTPFQVRRSNNYTIKAVLHQWNIAADMLHIPDDPVVTRTTIEQCLQQYDAIVLTGGISMGKFDYIPQALDACNVKKLFHKVQQRPGKPFWFGKHGSGVLVFAFPGNPVSTFMCLHRYFIPWFEKSMGIGSRKLYAVLGEDYVFSPQLQYFLQVQLVQSDTAQLVGIPVTGNGSGDFANLTGTDAFMELPLERNTFTKGEMFPVWPFAFGND